SNTFSEIAVLKSLPTASVNASIFSDSMRESWSSCPTRHSYDLVMLLSKYVLCSSTRPSSRSAGSTTSTTCIFKSAFDIFVLLGDPALEGQAPFKNEHKGGVAPFLAELSRFVRNVSKLFRIKVTTRW